MQATPSSSPPAASAAPKRERSPAAAETFAKRHHVVEVIDLTGDLPEGSPRLDAPFQLLRVREGLIPAWASEGFLGARLSDLIQAPLSWCMVSNYMMDLPWLLSACPALIQARRVVLVHGEKACGDNITDGRLEGRLLPHLPHLPPYGTHHSKFFILQYEGRGLRVVLMTANAIYCDLNNKSQGLYTQDFPLKDAASPPSSPFETDLREYLAALGLSPPLLQEAVEIVALHDFSAARVHLVASVPGTHYGDKMRAFGHLKLRACLSREPGGFPPSFQHAPLSAQYSSIGNLSSNWLLNDFVASASAGHNGNGQQLGRPQLPAGLHLVWPTVAEVQNSVEGWFAGGSLPGYPDKVGKDFLQPHYCSWGGQPVGRQRAMPHVKSFLRFDPGSNEVAWMCMTSHNLSKAAWGEVQDSKKHRRTQLKILSFELGALLVPSLEKAYRCSRWCGFSCTDPNAVSGPMPGAAESSRVRFVAWKRGTPQHATIAGGLLTVPLPVPYALPPKRYEEGDVPWDLRLWQGLDALGFPFPGEGKRYGLLEDQEWADVVGQPATGLAAVGQPAAQAMGAGVGAEAAPLEAAAATQEDVQPPATLAAPPPTSVAAPPTAPSATPQGYSLLDIWLADDD